MKENKLLCKEYIDNRVLVKAYKSWVTTCSTHGGVFSIQIIQLVIQLAFWHT